MFLFVYGSLKKGGSNHSLLEGCKLAGTGTIMANLYDLGIDYPGAIEEGTRDKTFGELYEIHPGTLDELDEFEGFYEDAPEDSIFIRKEVDVTLKDRSIQKAQVYLLNPDKLSLFFYHPIREGIWNS